ncbi:MAG: S-layer homology domain-containing protein [bacterium]|nr:S-layer homology domain-containing protein [bacterium]
MADALAGLGRLRMLSALILKRWVAASSVVAVLAVGAVAAAQSGDDCYAGLVVGPGESCTYPGTTQEFSVDDAGWGHFIFAASGTGIDMRGTTFNGVTYNFKASKQADGTWLIETAGATTTTNTTVVSTGFPDVAPDHYAFEAVEWAVEVGVTAGYTDGTFKPQRPLIKRHAVVFMERFYDEILQAEESEDFTRADMMVLLKAINDGTIRGTGSGTAAESPSRQGASRRFSDVAPDHYAFEAVEWAVEVGVTAGYTDGTFKPQRPLIKRHAVVFMERFYDEILQAEESEDFTRADMMVLLKAINDGTLTAARQAPGSDAMFPGSPESDRAALVALYHATDGPNWHVNDNWLTDEPLGNWYGVTTDHTGRVVRLVQHYNGLAGELPPQLGDLDAVETVELNGIDSNNLDLSPLSGLARLRHLTLFSSQVSDLSGLTDLPQLETLQLSDNEIHDLSPILRLHSLRTLNVAENPLSRRSVHTLIPILEARGVQVYHHGYALGDGDLTVEDGPLIYNDNLVVLPVAKGSGLLAYTSTFYRHFEDDFDFLVIVNIDGESEIGAGGYYIPVANDIQGIGQALYSYSNEFGSAGKLHGVPYFSEPWWFRGIILHEVMHRWAAYGHHPLAHGSHFADFSNIFGAFGGEFSSSFDQIVDLGDGQFRADKQEWSYTYGPLELYFAGLIPSEEVPDFWVAVDGAWVDQESGVFSATRIEPFTVTDVIAAYGRRVPHVSSSQREFRAAVILLLDEQNPTVDSKLLESLSSDIAWFSFIGADESSEENFFEATGGRATFRTDGLAQTLNN